jgi:O6-methylguanine-DNA--protein-cysteine methyltransferase
MPAARREPKPGQLAEYERQLKVWKRRRTIARGKVAKYARLVRYHRKPREKQPSDQ